MSVITSEIQTNVLPASMDSAGALEFQHNTEKLDWKSHIVSFVNFVPNKAKDILQSIQNKEFIDSFSKVYLFAEYLPWVNHFLGTLRVSYAIVYTAKVILESLTIRLWKGGVSETIQKLYKEELPYVLKHLARGLLISWNIATAICDYDPQTSPIHLFWANWQTVYLTNLCTYIYDAITNTEALKQHKYIPNFWV